MDEAPCFANRTGLTYLPAAASLPPDVRDQLQENPFVRLAPAPAAPGDTSELLKEPVK
jgi:hypothetical protein